MIISSRASRSMIWADKVEALLGREPGDDADHRQARIRIGNAKAREQVLLAFGFAGQILRASSGLSMNLSVSGLHSS